MPIIVKKGTLPQTPHTEFRNKDGSLALEEIHGSQGFDGPWTRKLHYSAYPTLQSKAPVGADFSYVPEIAEEAQVLQPYLLHSSKIPYSTNVFDGKTILFVGPQTRVSVQKFQGSFPEKSFFRNGAFHDLFFVQEGEGVLRSEFGDLPFKKHDYINVPKGVTYRIELKSKNVFFFQIESRQPIEWPGHYLNQAGQAKMIAPIVETEIIVPDFKEAIREEAEFSVYVQHHGGFVTRLTLPQHPFDLIGWEGALYPFVFPVENHHGIAREIHTAPPAHQTFQSGTAPHNGFSVCSFVPQMEGWHPQEVPAPYAHHNVDSDEVMFFSNTSYGPRKGVLEEGTMTFHPSAVPHSPHGKAAEKSLDSRGMLNQRLAVMMDTFFEELQPTVDAVSYSDRDYALSWYKA